MLETDCILMLSCGVVGINKICSFGCGCANHSLGFPDVGCQKWAPPIVAVSGVDISRLWLPPRRVRLRCGSICKLRFGPFMCGLPASQRWMVTLYWMNINVHPDFRLPVSRHTHGHALRVRGLFSFNCSLNAWKISHSHGRIQ